MYKILSIDGGGLHGYTDVVILKRLIEKCPNLLKEVDVIAGTSVGGIIGLGMAMGHTIDVIENNFITGVPLAFTSNTTRLLGFYAGICSKYNTNKFKKFLDFVYCGMSLKNLKKKVVVPTFCLDDGQTERRRWKPKIFHNFPGTDCDSEVKLVDVAMATSAVPVFFPSYKSYIDGAVIANNPALCAIAQSQDSRNKEPNPDLKDVCVLSLGTNRDLYVERKNADWGYFRWIKTILQLLPEKDLSIVNYQSNLLLGERYHRIEPRIEGPLDDINAFDSMGERGWKYPINDTVNWLHKYWV